MKLVKKSLLVVSALALGVTLAGCTNGNVASYSYKGKVNYSTKYSTLDKLCNIEVKSYERFGNNRYIKYKSVDDKTVIYDYRYDKVVFSTDETITRIYSYQDNNLLDITYSDGTREMRMTNGDVVVQRGNYTSLNSFDVKTVYNYKEKDYKTLYFCTETNTVGNRDVNYYKIMYKGMKNSKKSVVLDENPDSYTLSSVLIDEIRKYKTGDEYLVDSNYYTSYSSGSSVVFYDSSSNKVAVTLGYGTNVYPKVFVCKDKAIVQLYKSVSGNIEYDVFDGISSYYIVDTYKVDLKKGTYEKLNDFKYFLRSATSTRCSKGFIIYDAMVMKGSTIVATSDVLFDMNFNEVQSSNKYAYNNTYVDLGGTLITQYDSVTYLTDTTGKIKRVYNGDFVVLEEAKVIAILEGTKLFFIDYNGNKITDGFIVARSIYRLDGKTLHYYDIRDDKNHIALFDKKKLVTDEEVGYSLVNSRTSISSLYYASESVRYNVYDKNYYYNLTLHDDDSDLIYDNFDVNFYMSDGTTMGSIEKTSILDTISYQYTDMYGDECEFYLAYQTTTEGTLILQMYEVK